MSRALLALLCFTLGAPAWAVERFAVVVGNNRGGEGRSPLWYAERDAERMSRALTELGDFPERNVRLIRGAGADQVRAGVRELEAAIGQARLRGGRAMLVFYFSGHADADALELGADRLRYAELRKLIQASTADIKVAVVDACQAGGLTQVKGARAVPLSRWELPAADSVEGVAFIASTAVGELAQESAFLGGSFFSHHLEMALRGGGDTDGDGQVTLSEAFRYASHRTVSGTAATQVGAQHPTYEVRMSGRGDVVLTELRRGEARLLLPGGADAVYVLRGPAGMVAEVPGAARELSLALPAGEYQVDRRSGDTLASATVRLLAGQVHPLPSLGGRPLQLASRKGGGIPAEVFLGGVLAREAINLQGALGGGRLGLRTRLAGLAWQLRLDLVGTAAPTYSYRELGASLSALWPVLELSWLRLEAGPELGGRWASQGLSLSQHDAGQLVLGGLLSVSAPLGPVRVGLQGGAGGQLFILEGQPALRPDLHASAVLSYAFSF
ncbi:MAG: caspase family protein [Myxococcota bacterium]|nr:caspase family protein [Myxococcota bacterium]